MPFEMSAGGKLMVETKNIKNVRGFLDWMNAPGAQMLYRGQKSSTWKVSPSLCRRPNANGGKDKEMKIFKLWERTQVIIRQAQELGHHYKNGGAQHDVLSLLAHLQHYGAATCLIDFTRSPLVALWFACQPCGRKQGKVISVDSSRCERVIANKHQDALNNWRDRAMAMKNPEDQDYVLLWTWRPERPNNRIIVQQSEFIFGKTVLDEEDIYKEATIDGDHKSHILNELKEIGISKESLFPDFEGFVHANGHDSVFPDISGEHHYKEGVECYDNEEYEHALFFFNLAGKRYEKEQIKPPRQFSRYIKITQGLNETLKIKGTFIKHML